VGLEKISIDGLKRVFADLRTGDEKAVGAWLFKGFRVQVSHYHASGAERSYRLYGKRKKMGLCVRCGAKVTKRNPRTGTLYRLCENHRKKLDRK
jgi:hypothetical protein